MSLSIMTQNKYIRRNIKKILMIKNDSFIFYNFVFFSLAFIDSFLYAIYYDSSSSSSRITFFLVLSYFIKKSWNHPLMSVMSLIVPQNIYSTILLFIVNIYRFRHKSLFTFVSWYYFLSISLFLMLTNTRYIDL